MQIWYRMLELVQNRTSVNIMKHMVIIVGLVRKLPVIQKDILQALALLGLWCNPNWRSLFCWSCAKVVDLMHGVLQ